MIEQFEQVNTTENVLKLAALPRESLGIVLLRRGIPEDSIDEAIQGISDLGTPISVEDLVAFPFRPDATRDIPFRSGRFHDGKEFGVYYSAIEPETCQAEVSFHLRKEGLQNSLAYPRYYNLVRSEFSGTLLNLIGREAEHEYLVSATEAGYPSCRQLAAEARLQGVDALKTRSARSQTGVCVPVLSQGSIGGHVVLLAVRMRLENQDIVVDQLP